MIAVVVGGVSGTLAAIYLLREVAGRHLRDPLLRHLVDSSLARPGSTAAETGHRRARRPARRGVAGPPATSSPLAPPLRGRWYETTAIPEIRDRAAALAGYLLNRQAHPDPRSAA